MALTACCCLTFVLHSLKVTQIQQLIPVHTNVHHSICLHSPFLLWVLMLLSSSDIF